jgi:hypothetical protein
MSRAGRKRKSGNRYANDRLRPERQPSPLLVAASMPHRRPLGALVVPAGEKIAEALLDQRAESELGRMALLGRIYDHQFAAGQRYLEVVSAYRSTIKAPHGLESGARGYDCRGDSDCPNCECARRRAKYDDAYCALVVKVYQVLVAVNRVVIQDQRCPAAWREALNLGLTALAQHFGLTNGRKSAH